MSVVIDGVLGPPRLARHTWRCPCISVVPEATHEASRGSYWEERKRIVFPRWGDWFAWYFSKRKRWMKSGVGGQTWMTPVDHWRGLEHFRHSQTLCVSHVGSVLGLEFLSWTCRRKSSLCNFFRRPEIIGKKLRRCKFESFWLNIFSQEVYIRVKFGIDGIIRKK